MKTINTSAATAVNMNGSLNEQNAFNNKISMELAELFWINNTKNNIHNILNTKNDTEVNSMEKELSEQFEQMLWVNNITKEMIALNNPKFSIDSVMQSYEEYEDYVA